MTELRLLVLSGFLGAGKTTLLLAMVGRLRARPLRIVIIENEVGEVGIDGQYLQREGLQVQELYAGCVCCTLAADLVVTLGKVRDAFSPDLVMVEATGIALPGDIVRTVRRWTDVGDVRVLTVVDAPRYDMLREAVGPLVTAQIEAADVVAVNKIDEVDPTTVDRVVSEVASLNPRAQVVPVSANKDLHLDLLLEALA